MGEKNMLEYYVVHKGRERGMLNEGTGAANLLQAGRQYSIRFKIACKDRERDIYSIHV